MRVFGFLVLGLCVSSLFAQDESASITGSVRDVSGAIIPGVKVELQSAISREVAVAVSGQTGEYLFAGLRAGQYDLKFSAPGFYSLTVKSISVSDGEQKVIPAAPLEVQRCGPVQAASSLRFLAEGVHTGNLGGSVTVDPWPMLSYGTPLPGAKVELLCGKIACGVTTTNSKGEFLFESVRPGSFNLRVSAAGFYTAEAWDFKARDGLELIYWPPVEVERCYRDNCAPRKRPKRPIVACE
jgi:Carboxypeptidase regulatory-like domain